MIVLRRLHLATLINTRTHKNFGHKRQPEPTVTVLWQGFLTVLFLGMCIEWKKIARFVIGKDSESQAEIAEETNKR